MVIMESDVVVQLDNMTALIVRPSDDGRNGIMVYNIALPNNTMKGMSFYTREQADRLMKALGQALYEEKD